jgi:hypothetical protein
VKEYKVDWNIRVVFAVRLLLHDEETNMSIQALLLVEDNDKECWWAV